MNDLQAVLAILIFFISAYLVYDLLTNGFSWTVLLVCIGGFVLVHFILPKSRDQDSAWYESLEFIFDFPFRAIAYSLRGIGRAFGKGDVDLDI